MPVAVPSVMLLASLIYGAGGSVVDGLAAKLRRSRLPRRTTVGWRVWASMKSPTTPASCGPAGAGAWAGR